MCGIAGKLNFEGPVEPGLLERMCAAMEHRGPDARGVFTESGVAIGAQRLAIIDVTGGRQPVFNEDGSVVVVLNGEIYNFETLRAELISRGHSFRSGVDTEVLAHLYEECGPDLVKHLRGMFAFAIWDRTRRRLLCARDRVGKKPLFWVRQGSRIWFGSEMLSLIQDPEIDREIDPRAIVSYLTFGFVPHPLSAFATVNKLAPGCTLVATPTKTTIERYWTLDYADKLDEPLPELSERLRSHIDEAVRIRLVSEVPLGAFLSGGIDSSAVVASMARQSSGPVKTFSIGFGEDGYDELRYARLVAERFSTDHHEFRVSPDAVAVMPTLARHYGEPFADPSALPSYYLAQLTAEHVTVALNGDGGDESFGGYDRYVRNHAAGQLDWLPRSLRRQPSHLGRVLGEGPREQSLRSRFGRLSRALAMAPGARFAKTLSTFDPADRRVLLTPEFAALTDGFEPETAVIDSWSRVASESRVDRMLGADVGIYLPGALLVKMDIATMAHSVEARSPLLDHRLMEFAASLPGRHKLRGLSGKRILKTALRGTIPDEVLDRPKMGFDVPLSDWFRGELRHLPGDLLLDPQAIDRGYFQRATIERLIREHQSGVADHAARLWTLMQLEMWQREVVCSPIPVASVTAQT